MRIGLIGPLRPDHFADHLHDTLPRMGHDAIALGSIRPGGGSGIGTLFGETIRKFHAAEVRSQRRILSDIRDQDLDLVITVEATLLPETVEALKKVSRRVVLWFPDAISNLGRMLMFAAPYDALFVKEPLLIERARDMLGAPIFYLTQGCNSRSHRPPDVELEHVAVLSAGVLHPWRVKLLERLADAGVPLRLFGPPIPRWLNSPTLEGFHTGRYVTRLEKATEYRSTSVLLNSMHPSEVYGVNGRLFEATGCGATVLMDHRSEIARFFEPDKELLTFSTFEELLEKTLFVFENPSEGRRLGDAASQRAHAEHTYEARLTSMFEMLGMAG